MPVGEAQASFQAAAARDGVLLDQAKVPWINQRGHFGLPPEAADAWDALDVIFRELGGDPSVQAAKKLTPLPGDFIHRPTGTFIETDEMQHFTSFRLKTLELYPDGIPLAFDLGAYSVHCQELASQADKYRATKEASGFGRGGRQRQRAYYDALRDLAVPAMGHPPLIRIPIFDGDGRAAWFRHRDYILAALIE
ncbi:DUF7255 family protein [Sinomonas gamaensis]|uniref:DUF7255 family protein n=1 Tax=Sinomonas gamaensis TaxID=2565624 RepID=UPI00110979B4|nr:hypothetical protein [Sinomonas gamaensis]